MTINEHKKYSNNEKKIKFAIGIMFVIPIIYCLFLIYDKSNVSLKTNNIKVNLGVNAKEEIFVREIEGNTYSSEELNIMGYQDFDYAQAMSFVLNKAKASSYGIDGMDLNGLTLKEHLVNLNTVCYLENINPGVALAQQVLETSIYEYKYMTTTSDGQVVEKKSVVKPSDYNFAGIGAVDSGKTCNSFSNDYEGQLAQIQHLKAYASTEPLNTELVDPRFGFVTRGKASTVAGLSKAWASNENYGNKIAQLYTDLMNHVIDEDLIKEYKDKTF